MQRATYGYRRNNGWQTPLADNSADNVQAEQVAAKVGQPKTEAADNAAGRMQVQQAESVAAAANMANVGVSVSDNLRLPKDEPKATAAARKSARANRAVQENQAAERVDVPVENTAQGIAGALAEVREETAKQQDKQENAAVVPSETVDARGTVQAGEHIDRLQGIAHSEIAKSVQAAKRYKRKGDQERTRAANQRAMRQRAKVWDIEDDIKAVLTGKKLLEDVKNALYAHLFPNVLAEMEAVLKGDRDENVPSESVVAPTQKQIDEFVDNALAENDPRGELPLWEVSQREVDLIKAQADLDVSGLVHVLDAQELKHAMRKHQNDKTEATKQPQENLTAEHLKRIPEILRDFDDLTVQKRGLNRSSLVYRKEFNDGKIEYVERVFETSAKNKPRLSTKTIWVVSPTAATAATQQVYTPERQTNHTPKTESVQDDVDRLPVKADAINLKLSGWWDKQPDNVAVFLIGKSRGNDSLKITRYEDGTFDAFISIAGVAGGKHGADAVELRRWVNTRLQLASGALNKLKLVKGFGAADADGLKFNIAADTDLSKSRYDEMKANGETELTFKQWQQVRTPEFKAWFGDWENDPENASKVVNPKTGEPLVVYHGTDNDFTEFKYSGVRDDGYYGKGYYFAGRKGEAKRYGSKNLMPVFLNIRKPYERPVYANPLDAVHDMGLAEDEATDAQWAQANARVAELENGWLSNREIDSAMSNGKFDGVLVLNRGRDGSPMRKLGYAELVAAKANQIKSATDNSGAFDPSNDDIRFSLNEAEESAFARAVDKVVDGKVKHNKYVTLGTTPDVLKMLGLPDVSFKISESVIEKAIAQQLGNTIVKHKHPHNLTAESLKQLPKQLNSPVAVMKSGERSTNPNGYVILTELTERENGKNKPVIAALNLKRVGDAVEVVNVASVHGRRPSQIENMFNDGLLYVHMAKGRLLSDAVGVQFPQSLADKSSLSNRNIKTESDLAQYQNGIQSLESGREQAARFLDSGKRGDIPAIQTALNQALGEYAPKVRLISAIEDMPEHTKQLINGRVEGWFNPKNGQIALVRENLTPERAVWVAWHELGHRGFAVRGYAQYGLNLDRLGKNLIVKTLADKIMADRKGLNDPAASRRSVAIEEALVELYAAQQTGNLAQLLERYNVGGLSTVNGAAEAETAVKTLLERFIQALRNALVKVFGKDKPQAVEAMTDSEVFALLADLHRANADGKRAVDSSDGLKFSIAAERDSFRETEARIGGRAAYNKANVLGKTDLTYHQWVQVRTPEFKAWFGDWENDPRNASQVMNKRTKEPLPVYHGTNSSFDAFFNGARYNKAAGIFFTEDAEVARTYGGNVLPVFLNVRRPKRRNAKGVTYYNLPQVFDDTEFGGDKFVATSTTDAFIKQSSYKSRFHDGVYLADSRDELFTSGDDAKPSNVWVAFDPTQAKPSNVWVAFDPTQAKHAYENSGAFDGKDDRFRFSIGQMQDDAELVRMATPLREAKTFDEARAAVGGLLNQPFTNKSNGMVATVSKRSLDKMLSGKAHNKSIDLDSHLMAVANVDRLFENAVDGWLEPHKSDTVNIAGMRKLFAPLLIDGGVKLVKLTVKEMNFNQGNRIYSVETIEIENGTVPEMTEDNAGNGSSAPHRLHSANTQILIERIQDFNRRAELADTRYSASVPTGAVGADGAIGGNIGHAVKAVVGKDGRLAEFAKDKWANSRAAQLQLLGRRQITGIYGKDLKGLEEYERLTELFGADALIRND